MSIISSHPERLIIAGEFEIAATARCPDRTFPVNRKASAARVKLLSRKHRGQAPPRDPAIDADTYLL